MRPVILKYICHLQKTKLHENMWHSLARFILRYRIILLGFLIIFTAFMAYHTSQVKLSYEFNSVIPASNTIEVDYLNFKNQFGEDGNMVVLGLQTDKFFQPELISDSAALAEKI